MRLGPYQWGPYIWGVIHAWALTYDPANHSQAAAYFNALPSLIPCPSCASHFTDILTANPVEPWLSDRASLVQWTVDVHNAVNERLGKPIMSLDDFYRSRGISVVNGHPQPPVLTAIWGRVVQRLFQRGQ